ncbi:MAG: cyclic nucleotide-binding domain-containing protein, partial [Chrysiogenetes bacterium]|nr:cyclic nucleotide-binding domain-containing protein [Chrysiogenetes bacterium]
MSVPLFSGLSRDKLAELAEELRPASFAKGARIFHEGCDPDSFFLITDGWVKISRDTASGRSVVFELRGP